MSDNSLAERCYEFLHKIPRGKVSTYKILGDSLGTKGYRAIGQILKKNPNPISCPCHRVVLSDGKIGGFAFGAAKKVELLEGEGVKIENNRIFNFANILYYGKD
jgi:methylated-DNA-[protein]-cysteine S-methyltransferase